jgi:crotonobetainyl-CoA:carnitine CoA-transferase CaiB-like acyl-CoA transferase
VDTPPPTLGQHNQRIFGALGLTNVELAGLKAKGVI